MSFIIQTQHLSLFFFFLIYGLSGGRPGIQLCNSLLCRTTLGLSIFDTAWVWEKSGRSDSITH
jgi:hypothetical protein